MKRLFFGSSFLFAVLIANLSGGSSALAQTGVITDPLDPTQGGKPAVTPPQKSACPPRHARVKISFELDGAEIAAAACVSRQKDQEFLIKTLDVLSTLGKMEFLEAVDAAQPKK
jgi:hypothetical protein